MANRLALVGQQIGGNQQKNKVGKVENIVASSFDYLSLEEYLGPQDNKIRLEVRQFVEKHVVQESIRSVEKCQFSSEIQKKLRESDISRYLFDKPYGSSSRLTVKCLTICEFAKGDPGTAIFLSHSMILAQTINILGKQQHKNRYLPKIASFEIKGQLQPHLFAPSVKSNKIRASHLLNGTNYRLNNIDLLCIITQDEFQNSQAFLVETSQVKKMQVKQTTNSNFLRNIPHYHLTFTDTVIKEQQKLNPPENHILKLHSLSILTHLWIAAGICMGSYQTAIQHATKRQQFGRSVSAFQMVQQKLVKMMASTQSVLLLCFRITKMTEQNQSDAGMISMAQAYVMERSRQCCHLGRQIMGGNGILSQNYCMRALADLQALACLQGTPAQNALLCGLSLTLPQRSTSE